MRDDTFWRVMAVLALVTALAYTVSRFWSAPDPVHAQAGGTIAVTGNEQSYHRLYLIDSGKRVILVYGPKGRNQYSWSLLAARYYGVDAEATVKKEFEFRTSGYPITEMQKYAVPPTAPRRTR